MDLKTSAVEIVAIDTPSLGDRSYLVHDGTYAVVIDPQRDTDRVADVVAAHGLTITHVLETHIHNDYVTGGYALAQRVGAAYVVNAADTVGYQRLSAHDGDVLEAGPRMRVRVLHTPGHTFTHLSYALEVDGRVTAVFTGGSLLYGATGRPDLLGAQHAETLARHQHASAHRLVAELPADTQVYPTHGFGSFCAATQAQGLSSTLANEARVNPALTQAEEDYVAGLLAGLDAYPAYYAHMGPANAAGPTPIDLSPPHVADPAELRQRIDAGEWVVDLRNRTAFAAGHLPGTLNFALHDSFVTYLGWLIPWGTPVTLLGETADEVAAAQRDLTRIGIDRPAAAATGKPEDWADGRDLDSFPTATFEDLAALLNGHHAHPVVLDVRRNDERRDSYVNGTVHIPIHELPARLDEVPGDRPVWVHCAAGYRASIAASLLHRAGRDVVAIHDDYTAAHRRAAHRRASRLRPDSLSLTFAKGHPVTTQPRPARLDPATVRDWLSGDDGPRLLDVRSPAEFETAHIPGSYNVPLHLLREHRGEISRHLDQVVLVCRSGNRAAQAELVLAETGMTNLHLLDGGILAWQDAGAPLKRGRARWDLERQVRLTAGTLVAAGVTGSLALPGLQWFAAAIGAGLAVAALTNTCLMGNLLSKLPFNRAASCDVDTVVRQLTDAGTVRS